MCKGWLPWEALQNQLPFWTTHFLPPLTPVLLAECRWDWGTTYSEALGSTLKFILGSTLVLK